MVPSGMLTGCHTQPLRSALRRIEVGCTPLSGGPQYPVGPLGAMVPLVHTVTVRS